MPDKKDDVAFWQEEMETENPRLARFVSEMLDSQRRIIKQLDNMAREQSATRRDVDQVRNAFAENDFDGHRRYHQTLIDGLEERRRLRKAIQEKTISGLVWAAIVWFSTKAYDTILKTWGH